MPERSVTEHPGAATGTVTGTAIGIDGPGAPGQESRDIVVIGGGPRGISAVERLAANAEALGSGPLRITVVEPFDVGGGRVWDAAQPSHLLMNTLCADATHFTDDSVDIAGPIRPGPTLYEWGRLVRAGEITTVGGAPLGTDLRRETEVMRPFSHPSRKILGTYLQWAHERDLERLPAHVEVRAVQGWARRIRPAGACAERGRWSIEVVPTAGLFSAEAELLGRSGDGARPPAGRRLAADAVVIASGHTDNVPNPVEQELLDHARAHGLTYLLPSNPLSQTGLDRLRPGEDVIVRGLGMNFFDYMSLLTVGRGGRFITGDDGELHYEPSGSEPHLIAGSRRGVPYRAKGLFERMTPRFPRRFLTSDVVRAFAEQEEQIDFMADLYPLICKDTLLTYYTVLHEQCPEAFAVPATETGGIDAATGRATDRAMGPATGLDLVVRALETYPRDDADLQARLAEIVPDPDHRLDLGALDRPLAGRSFADAGALRTWWLEDLRADLREARDGMRSPLKCASVQQGGGRNPLNTLARYGHIQGVSYLHDAEGWFRGFGGMLASGPPAQRIAELIALVEAGIVTPLGAHMQVRADGDAFAADSPTVPGARYRVRAVLEAHLPGVSLQSAANPVLAGLREDGRARPFRIPDPEAGFAVSGALEVGPPPSRVVAADGAEQDGLYAVGVPLEGILRGTPLQPLAGTNSRMLREIDAVARDALRIVARPAPHRPEPAVPDAAR